MQAVKLRRQTKALNPKTLNKNRLTTIKPYLINILFTLISLFYKVLISRKLFLILLMFPVG